MIYTSAILATMLAQRAVGMKENKGMTRPALQPAFDESDDEINPGVTGVRLPNGELIPCPPNPGTINWQFLNGTQNPAWEKQATLRTIKTEQTDYGLGHTMIANAIKVDDNKAMRMREMVWWSTPPQEMIGDAREFKTFDVAGCQFGRQSNDICEIPDFAANRGSCCSTPPDNSMTGTLSARKAFIPIHRDDHLLAAKKIKWDQVRVSTPKFTCHQVWQTAIFGKLISDNMNQGAPRINVMCRYPSTSDNFYVADFPKSQFSKYLKLKPKEDLLAYWISQSPAEAHYIKHLTGEEFVNASTKQFGNYPHKMEVRLIDDRLHADMQGRVVELLTEHFERPNGKLSGPGYIDEYKQSRVWNEIPDSRFKIERWGEIKKNQKKVYISKDIDHDANSGSHDIYLPDAFPITKGACGDPYGF